MTISSPEIVYGPRDRPGGRLGGIARDRKAAAITAAAKTNGTSSSTR